MTAEILDARLAEELASIALRCGCELLDARFHRSVLRLVLDRKEGIGVEDCARVSREVSALLDVEDFGPANYSLEVTSPGLDRQFYLDSDYERFSGHNICVTWMGGKKKTKRTVVGRLETAHLQNGKDPKDRFIEVTTEQERLIIPLLEIVVARLEPEI